MTSRRFEDKTAILTGGAKGIGSSQDETLSLGIEQFITLMVHLAFGRDNPRYVAAKESKKEETVPVLQCVQNLMNEFLPRMHKGNAPEFRSVLKGDAEAQSVIASYSEKIGQWVQKLAEKAEKTNSDVYTQFVAFLEEKGCLGTRSIETTEASGLQVTHKSSLTDLQARGEISLTDGRAIPVWFDLADPFAPEVLAEKLQRKSSTIIGEASAAIWSLHPRLGQLGARDIASAMLAASA